MRSITRSVILSSIAGMSLLASELEASLSIDLRFTDGSRNKAVNTGDLTPITIQAWAVVTGAAGNGLEEGLSSVITAVKSTVLAGSPGGSITSGSLATGWTATNSFSGSSSNISPDGIGDWGNVCNTTLTLTQGFFRAKSNKTAWNTVDWGDADSPVGSTHHAIADGGEEFLIGYFVFTPTSWPAGASVRFSPVAPPGGSNATGIWYEDTTDKTLATPNGNRSNLTGGTYGPITPNTAGINSVTIGLPEPTSLSLLGLSGIIGLHRRRRAVETPTGDDKPEPN